MSFLSKIIPQLESDTALVSVKIAEPLMEAHFFTVANRLLKKIKLRTDSTHKLRDRVQLLSPSVKILSDDDVDELLTKMLLVEHRISNFRAYSKEITAKIILDNKNKSTVRRSLARRIANASDGMYLEFLRFTRDARWEVMAVRAEAEPESNEPEISSEEELSSFFDSLQTA